MLLILYWFNLNIFLKVGILGIVQLLMQKAKFSMQITWYVNVNLSRYPKIPRQLKFFL